MTKDKLIKKYNKYIQLLGIVGGALTVNDFIYLFNIYYKTEIEEGEIKPFNYSKVVRDFRKLREQLEKKDNEFELLNVYRSSVENEVGVPSGSYIMCLTNKGWYYYNKSRRGEVKFENPDTMRAIRFNAYKKIVKSDVYANHKLNVEKILRDYNMLDNQIKTNNQEFIEIDKILSSDKFLLESIRFYEGDDIFQSLYSIKVIYFEDTLVYRNLCETLDKLLGFLERTYALYGEGDEWMNAPPAQVFIELDCITTNRANISKFVDYRNRYSRRYSYYDYVHKKSSKNSKNFRSYFGKTIKRIDFYTIDSKYNLTNY